LIWLLDLREVAAALSLFTRPLRRRQFNRNRQDFDDLDDDVALEQSVGHGAMIARAGAAVVTFRDRAAQLSAFQSPLL
jgi:hypothetical protein